jgi:hypothetical protein
MGSGSSLIVMQIRAEACQMRLLRVRLEELLTLSLGSSDARLTLAAVLAALPCGYCFGVVAAFLLAGGPNVGQAPLWTVPLGLLLAVLFALLPFVGAQTRFMTMVVGAIASADVFLMVQSAFP